MKINNNNQLGVNNKLNFTNFDTNDVLKNIKESKDINNKEFYSTFNHVMSESVFSTMDTQLKEILSKIDKQKEKLIKDSSVVEFRVYKSLISEFIQVINSKSKLKEQIFFDNVGRQKVLKNIESIDDKIKELQKEFINDNKNNIKIINLAEEIRGLVIDTVI